MRFRQFPVGTLIGHPWQSRAIIDRLNPDFKIGKAEIAEIAEYITRFSLAAILAGAVAVLRRAGGW
jgi:hypothetical protein